MSELNQLIEMYRRFRDKNWAPGGSCSIALFCYITDNSKKIYVTPDNFKDIQLNTSDIFLLRDLYGIQDIQAPLNQVDKSLKISRWAPILLEILGVNPANACVVQLSPPWSTLAGKYALTSWVNKGNSHPNILRLSYWKLLEKLTESASEEEFLIPIVNYGKPEELLIEIREILKLYPETCAVIVRDYGILVWGKSLSDVYNRVDVIEHVCQLQIQDSLLFDKINTN